MYSDAERAIMVIRSQKQTLRFSSEQEHVACISWQHQLYTASVKLANPENWHVHITQHKQQHIIQGASMLSLLYAFP